jgi:ARG and Rhodanese-Phosphatase-superfamily-associated Protein domain
VTKSRPANKKATKKKATKKKVTKKKATKKKATKKKVAVATLDPGTLRVSGPYEHRNLAVYFLHASQVAGPSFLTLAEGLAQKSVRVGEKAQAQVGELTIENQGDLPLFLHEGDRLRGGRQDRTVRSSLVIPAHSGQRALQAFCIERSRWGGGGDFEAPSDAGALAPKDVRAAAKVAGDQGQVWDSVARVKDLAERLLQARNRSSSLNELFAQPEVKKPSGYFVEALSPASAEERGAVGVAFAINGRLEEVDVYPSAELLAVIYPRLLASYALQAVVALGAEEAQPAPTSAQVSSFARSRYTRRRSRTQLDSDNELLIRTGKGKVVCVSSHAGEVIHQQVFAA